MQAKQLGETERENSFYATKSATAPLIGVLPGEGVGPEVIAAALDVLAAISARTDRKFNIELEGPQGLQRPAQTAYPFSDAVVSFCADILARNGVLFSGPAGGRFVYQIREYFDLYYKLVPLRARPTSADYSPLKQDRLEGADVLVVRENCGGLYFGEWGQDSENGTQLAYHRFQYTADEVDRILAVGKRYALGRRGHLSVIVKRSGVPAIADLWRQRLESVCVDAGLELELLEVDFAAYQIINNPRHFDVIVCSNMFGDVLADCGAAIIGSRGMSYSANYDGEGRAIYQTGHGAAHDLAGTDRANPIGQILSLAMMLRETLRLPGCAALTEHAVDAVLAAGYRTPDIHTAPCTLVGTREMGQHIAQAIEDAPDDALF